MRAAWHLAINSLAGKPGRTALLIMAIALASSLIVAAGSAIDTFSRSIRLNAGQTVGLSDVRIVHQFNMHLDAALLDTVRSWPQVQYAAPMFETSVSLRTAAGKQTLTLRGIDPDVEDQVSPHRMQAGRMVRAAGEVALTPYLARKLQVDVGDAVTALQFGEPVELRVVGIIDRPKLDVLQSRLAIATLPQVRSISGVEGKFNEIALRLHNPTMVESVRATYEPSLADGAAFQTPAAAAAGINRGLQVVRFMLMIVTMIVFLAAGFIVLTSLTNSVVERLRELAILRCIGAGRDQLAIAQLIGGAMLSLAGGLVGVAPGLALAYWWFTQHEAMLVAGFSPGYATIVQAVAAAMIAGLLGAAYPAVLAATASPLVGLAARAKKTSNLAMIATTIVGLLLATAPLIVRALPLDDQQWFWFHIVAGLPLMFIGFFLLSAPVLLVIGFFVAPLLAAALRVPADVLRQQTLATPYRNGFTAGALMVALAMLVAVNTIGGSIMKGWFDNIRMPDGFLHSYYALTDAQYDALQRVDAITDMCPTTAFPVIPKNIQFGVGALGPRATLFVSTDTDAFLRMTDIQWIEGDPRKAQARLREGNALLVSREYRTAHNLGLGDKLSLMTWRGNVEFDIVGVVSSPGLDVAVHFFDIHRAYGDAAVSAIFGTRQDAKRHFGVDAINLVLLSFKDDLTDEAVIGAINSAVPGVVVGASRRIRRQIERTAQGATAVFDTIAGALLIMACLGVGNLILASLAARWFEMGVLRAVGATPLMLGRLVAAQTLLIGLVGCVTGTALGVALANIARMLHQHLLGIEYTLHPPWRAIAWGSAIVLAAAVIAALPAIVRAATAHPRKLLAA
jgi:putative ABC transport system permease protein